MGIKDKVINILFDEDENANTSSNTKNLSRVKNNDNSSTFVDTAPIFIDANPSKKPIVQHEDSVREIVDEIKLDEGYHMTENISPIFGIQKSEVKTKKVSTKGKVESSTIMYDGLLNAGTNVSNSYSSVIISPIFGPLENKPTRKNPTRTNKKQADPFNRNIDDTGEFKTLYSKSEENEQTEDIDFESEAPKFDNAKEEKISTDDKLGDTDRLSKISDRINQIKNEASHIYSPGKVEHIESRKEVKKEAHNTISDLIHNFQKTDFNSNFSVLNNGQNNDANNDIEEVQQEENTEPVYEEEQTSNEIVSSNVVDEASFDNGQDFEQDVIEEDTNEPVVEDEVSNDDQTDDLVIENENNVNEAKEVRDDSDVVYNLDDTFNLINEKLDENAPSSIDDILDDGVDDTKDLFSDLFGDE